MCRLRIFLYFKLVFESEVHRNLKYRVVYVLKTLLRQPLLRIINYKS